MELQEKIKAIPSNRLQFFPIMMFATTMGLGGLTLTFVRLNETLFFPRAVATVMLIITSVLFLTASITYLSKIVKYPKEVLDELKHPIRINFFAAVSISLLILSINFESYHQFVAELLFYIGAGMHLIFTFYTVKHWFNQSLDIIHSNPAWFIPIVGNLIVPIAGSGIVSDSLLMFFFAIGIFFWIVLFAIILNRIIFHNPFPGKFMPTMFILIAPPAIGFISYMKLSNELDFFAQILFNLGLFFSILVFTMYRKFIKIKFFISWWAFVFPMAAVSLSNILMYKLTNEYIYEILAYTFSIITALLVALVSYKTIEHILKREICVME